MNNNRHISIILIIAVITIQFIACEAVGELSVVMSTSMLSSIAEEISPKSESINVITILPPSSCPGHFDLSPRIIPAIKSASIVVCHDYQGVIRNKLINMGVNSTSFRTVTTPESPLIPSNYNLLARQVGAMYKMIFPKYSVEIVSAVDSVKHRTDIISQQAVAAALQWKRRPVIAATHVAEFCQWLGFDVVGIIKRSENMTPLDLQKLLTLKADMIVANLQEGVQGAESLGKRMKLPVAILSNFPGVEEYGNDYYDLIEENLSRLEKAWHRQ